MLKTNNTKQRLISTAVMLSIVSLFGFVLCLIFQWPSQFVLGEVADSRVTLSDIVAGTPLSIPLAPWAALIMVTFLATSQRWWGTIAVVVLCLLGVLFVIGGWGEAFGPPNPYVPRPVLLVGGILWMLLGLSLLIFGVLELVNRLRSR